MSELGDKIVKDVAGHVGHTAEDWSELRAELIALRQYHTMAEGFGPIQAANKRTEQWKQAALDAQAKHAVLIEALRGLHGRIGHGGAWKELGRILDEHAR